MQGIYLIRNAILAMVVMMVCAVILNSCAEQDMPVTVAASQPSESAWEDWGMCLSGDEEVLVLDGRAVSLKRMTRGFRNKNPMNVVAMGTSNPWLGQVGKDDIGLAKFATWEHGLRAGYRTLKKYKEKRGVDTLFKLTSRYCEGDALRYAQHIGKELGVGPHDKVDIMAHAAAIMKAIIVMENGYNPFPDKYFVAFM